MKLLKNDQMEYVPLEANVIYSYLLAHAVGYENRLKSDEIISARPFIETNAQLRRAINTIRRSKKLTSIVCSEAGKNGGYWIANCKEDIIRTVEQLNHRADEMRDISKIIQKKSKLSFKRKF